MTLLDDRPTTPQEPIPEMPRSSQTAASPTATWNFASRLARREVRRRPGRTLLVMLLIAIPVMGMTTASILARTIALSNSDPFTRQYGNADLVVNSGSGSPFGFDRNTEIVGAAAPPLPDGTRIAEVMTVYSPVRADVDGVIATSYVQLTDADLDDPMFAGVGELTNGRLPTGPDEVLLSRRVADAFGVDVGDELRLVRPDLALAVVGVGRSADYYEQNLMVIPGFDRDLVVEDQLSISTLIDLPSTTTPEEIAAILDDYRAQGSSAFDRSDGWSYDGSSVSGQQLAWGWVAGAVAFVAVGIVIAAAFATSSRRQLVTIGQLSANGAPQRLVRRTMALQGAWTGVVGAIAGLTATLIGVRIGDHYGWVDRFAGRDAGPLVVVPLDLIVIAITAVAAAAGAALVPARSASRIPVLVALAGRRPIATPPRWLGPTGVALLIGGLILLFGAAGTQSADDVTAAVALVGSLAVLFGMVCASPLIVAAIGRIGSRFGGVVRLAARSLDRGRARSAAVLTAVATVIALAVAGATTVRTAENSEFVGYDPDLRTVAVSFVTDWYGDSVSAEDVSSTGVVDRGPQTPTQLPRQIRTTIETVLPEANWTPITMVVTDPAPYNVNLGRYVGDAFDGERIHLTQVAVADAALLERLGYSDSELAVLDELGVLAGYWTTEGGVVLDVDGRSIVVESPAADTDESTQLETTGTQMELVDGRLPSGDPRDIGYVADVDGRFIAEALVTEDFVRENGLEVAVSQYLVENPVDLTTAQRNAINELQPQFGPDAFVESASAPSYETPDTQSGDVWYAWTDSPIERTPWGLIELGVGLASLLMVLLVVAIGLSLAATESRDERDVLHAVGAAPKTLRRVAAAKAWVITTGAAVVAIPTGYVTMFVISRATDSTAPFPFALAAALLVAVPALTAVATFAVSAIAQRVRPITSSTIDVI